MAICCRSTSPLLLLFFQLGPDGSRSLHGCSQSHRAKKTSILSLSLSKVVAVSSLTFFAGWVPSALTVADNQVKPIRGQYGHLAKTLHKTCERGRECGTESKRKKKSFTDWLILNAASWAHVSNIFKFFMLCILMNNKDWFILIRFDWYLNFDKERPWWSWWSGSGYFAKKFWAVTVTPILKMPLIRMILFCKFH